MSENKAAVYMGILSGGAGTRLWPVSRKSYPKQFYSLAGDEPLLIETLKRVSDLGSLYVLTTEQLSFPTLGLMNRHGVKADIIAEPAPQNTAPIIATFNEVIFSKNPSAIICILPADHSIQPIEKFQTDLQKAISLAQQNKIVTFGIPPSSPSTAYGYLQTKEKEGTLEVSSFVEKPNETKATDLIKNGALWNSGIFVFKASVFKDALKRLAPELAQPLEKLQGNLSNLEDIYKELPSISIDYALMEKLSDIACVKASFDWSDLGSWEEVALRSKGNIDLFEVAASGNYYTSSKTSPKTVAFVGTKNIIAVDTPDALLILEKGHGQDVKALVDKIKTKRLKVSEEHSFEDRPWGRFEILSDSALFKSKLITVWAGQRLSYQSHKHRLEHWIIVEGEGDFTLNDKVQKVKAGDYLFIPLGAKHRISNTGKEKLEFVEVQIGSYFGEDDIVRYSDDYGRK